jgi:HEPN domain-containing protein
MDFSESDLRLAHLAAGDATIRREQVCFHAQQAVEKAVKAVLLARDINFPLTHDIETLIGLAEESGLAFPEDFKNAGTLTPYAAETRYPGSWMEISDEDVDEALRSAEKTVAWARLILL